MEDFYRIIKDDNYFKYLIVIMVFVAFIDVITMKWDSLREKTGVWGRIGTVLGWFLILCGLLGGIIPIMPGFPLVVAGLLLVGVDDPIIVNFLYILYKIALFFYNSSNKYIKKIGETLLKREANFIKRFYSDSNMKEWMIFLVKNHYK